MVVSLGGRTEIFGGEVVTHKGKTITDIGSSLNYNKFIEKLDSTPKKIAIITNEFQYRPDLIAKEAYGTPNLWWLVLVANNIFDIKKGLRAGTQIIIPQI